MSAGAQSPKKTIQELNSKVSHKTELNVYIRSTVFSFGSSLVETSSITMHSEVWA